jgi:hypothetical protein
MISIGGGPGNPPAEDFNDPWTNGMQIFDMTDLVWTESYNSSAAAYEPPSSVTQYYAANSRYPSSWIDPKLADIFRQTSSTSSSTSSSSTPLSSSNPTSSSTAPKKSHTGAIVAAAVSGVAGVAIIVGLSCWWAKRRTKPKYLHAPAGSPVGQGVFGGLGRRSSMEKSKTEGMAGSAITELGTYERPHELDQSHRWSASELGPSEHDSSTNHPAELSG